MIKDLKGLIFNKGLRLICSKTSRPIYTIILKIACKLKGIKLGYKTTFHGFTLFHRLPESMITIGERNSFLSKTSSNLIGINHRCIISTLTKEARITIGDSCGFSGTVISSAKSITLGNKVRCGANTIITDFDWHRDDKRSGKPAPIIIGDNVWLGVNSVVLKGVKIGENSVIGANSIVTKTIPANVIASGNPCKVIRAL